MTQHALLTFCIGQDGFTRDDIVQKFADLHAHKAAMRARDRATHAAEMGAYAPVPREVCRARGLIFSPTAEARRLPRGLDVTDADADTFSE